MQKPNKIFIPIFVITSAICSCSAFAVNGPYLGVSLGYTDAIFNVNQDATATITNIPIIGTITREHQKSFAGIVNGIQGQLVAGYAYDINNFNIAAEITYQLPTITQHYQNTEDDSYSYKFSYNYGINFVPGYYITERNLIYLKVGIVRGKFAGSEIGNDGIAIFDTPFYSNGLNLGIGSGIYLNKHIQLRLEYLFTAYQTYEAQRNINIVVPPPDNIDVNVNIKTKIQPKMHTFMLGLIYQFD